MQFGIRGMKFSGGMVKYRADIDGIRALAIISVVAFHAEIPGFSGGFVGVDVFFVISGFLITRIIVDEINSQAFSLASFYKRRAIRLLGPLFVVMGATLLMAYGVLFPSEMRELGKSITFTSIFASNFFFWPSSGYFGDAVEFKPLLHTWSLAVEEQFYLLFPVFFMFSYRQLRKYLSLILLVGIVLSLLLSVHGLSRGNALFTFYLLPTRVWELLIGSLVAVNWGRLSSINQRWIVNSASIMGVGLIVLGIVVLDKASVFPGLNALYPCVGAGLLIAFGKESVVARFLTIRLVVYVGLVSYCLYLWHWPVIVFSKLYFPDKFYGYPVFVVLVSFVLAVISRYLIEIPIRSAFSSTSPGQVVAVSCFLILLFSVAGYGISRMSVVNPDFPENAVKIASYADYRESPAFSYQFRKNCMLGSLYGDFSYFDKETCLKEDKNKKNYLIIGDSHAAHIWRAMQLEYPDINFLQATAVGCLPIVDGMGKRRCTDFMSYIFKAFLTTHQLDGVVIGGRWSDVSIAPLINTVKYVKKYTDHVIVFGPVVEYDGALPLLLARDRVNGSDQRIQNGMDKRRETLDAEMQKAMENAGIPYVSILKLVCPERDHCLHFVADDIPVQFDYGHFTLQGSQEIVRRINRDFPVLLNQ